MKKLFTERHGEAKPRVFETLDAATRNDLLTLISARIDEEWFGLSFPDKCPDGYAYAGTDFKKLRATMEGYGSRLGRRLEARSAGSMRIEKYAIAQAGVFTVTKCLCHFAVAQMDSRFSSRNPSTAPSNSGTWRRPPAFL